MSDSDPLAGAAQEWYKKGTDAMSRQNWDFAVECFSSAVKMKPDVVLYRQTKHLCCRKQFGDNGTGARMAGVKLMATRGRCKKARMSSDWAALDAAAEEGMLVNPWDGQLFADIGQASAELDRGEIADYAYGMACEIDKQNIPWLLARGYVLRERGNYDKARSCFLAVKKLDPVNAEARTMLGKIDAESTIDRSGLGKADSTRDVKSEDSKKAEVDAYEADRIARKGGQKEKAAPGESVEADLKAAIRKAPEAVGNYQKLADLMRDGRRFQESIEVLDKALELQPGSVGLMEMKEDIELELMREKLAEATERSRKYPDREPLKNKCLKLKEEMAAREIEIFAARVENSPNNMKMKVELAERYRKAKQFKLAIPLFQQSVADSRLKEDALVGLGECFMRSGKVDLGRRQFEKALETLDHDTKPDAFKNAHYFLGRLYEKAKKIDKAEHHYNEILSQDYEFRDVLKRMEELQGEDEFADFDDD